MVNPFLLAGAALVALGVYKAKTGGRPPSQGPGPAAEPVPVPVDQFRTTGVPDIVVRGDLSTMTPQQKAKAAGF